MQLPAPRCQRPASLAALDVKENFFHRRHLISPLTTAFV